VKSRRAWDRWSGLSVEARWAKAEAKPIAVAIAAMNDGFRVARPICSARLLPSTIDGGIARPPRRQF